MNFEVLGSLSFRILWQKNSLSIFTFDQNGLFSVYGSMFQLNSNCRKNCLCVSNATFVTGPFTSQKADSLWSHSKFCEECSVGQHLFMNCSYINRTRTCSKCLADSCSSVSHLGEGVLLKNCFSGCLLELSFEFYINQFFHQPVNQKIEVSCSNQHVVIIRYHRYILKQGGISCLS